MFYHGTSHMKLPGVIRTVRFGFERTLYVLLNIRSAKFCDSQYCSRWRPWLRNFYNEKLCFSNRGVKSEKLKNYVKVITKHIHSFTVQVDAKLFCVEVGEQGKCLRIINQ